MDLRTKRILSLFLAVAMIFSVFTVGTPAANAQNADASGTPITSDDAAKAYIAISPSASEVEQYAAKELQYHVEKVSGVKLDINEGIVDETIFRAAFLTESIVAVNEGYYPVEMLLTNPTNSSLTVSIEQQSLTENVDLFYRGTALVDGTVTVPAGKVITVSGAVYVKDPYALDNAELSLKFVKSGDSTELATAVLKLVGPAEASIVSGDFEDGSLGNWGINPVNCKGEVQVIEKSGNTENKALYLYERGYKPNGDRQSNQGGSYSAPLKLKPNTTYTISYLAKAATETEAKFAFRFWEMIDGSRTDSTWSKMQNQTLTGDWARYIFTFTTADVEASAYGDTLLYFFRDNGALYLDDFTIVENAATLTADQPIELLENGDFEYINLDAANKVIQFWPWGINCSHEAATESANVHGGSQAVYLSATNCKDSWHNNSYQESFKLKPNTTYEVSFWAKFASGDSTKVSCAVMISGNIIANIASGNIQNLGNKTISAQEWTKYTYTFTTSNFDTSAYTGSTLYLSHRRNAFYLDDFSLVEQNGVLVPAMAVPAESDFVPVNLTPIVIATPDTWTELNTLFSEEIAYLKALEVTDDGGSTKRYGDDGFSIQEKEDVIYIFGATAGGALNGVYDFIEENMGVIWTRADEEIGLIYEEMTTITAGKVNYHEKSPFAVRGWHLCGTGDGGAHTDKATEIMMSRNKLNAELAEPQDQAQWSWKTGIGIDPFHLTHNVDNLVLESPLYDETYEGYWNTDAEGNHYVPGGTGWNPNFNQINYWDQGANGYDEGTEAKTLQAVIASVKKHLDDNPTMKYVGIGVNDTNNCTQIPEQNTAFEYAEGKFVQPTDANYKSTVCFSFINKVAKAVKAEYPDATINAFAYSFAQIPPACEIEDNICLVFAPINEDVTESINTEGNRDKADLEAWKLKSDNIVVYNYYGSFYASASYERPIAELKIQKDLQYYAEQGLTGLMPEGLVDAGGSTKNWDMNSLTFWLYSKLAWNPDENVSELVKEFCDKSYGAASEYMQTYYSLLKEGWVEGSATPGVSVKYNTVLNFYIENFVMNDAERAAQMQTALDNAYNAANDVEKQRILYIKDTFAANVEGYDPVKEAATATHTTAGKAAVLATVNLEDPFADEIWTAATPLVRFLNPTTRQQVADASNMKVRLLWDEEYLYVGYENYYANIENMPTSSEVTSSGSWFVGNSEDVETYIAADPGSRMYDYFTSPGNASFRYYSENGTSPAYDSTVADWSTAAKIINVEDASQDRYVVIQAISFDSLGITETITSDTDVYAYFFRAYNGGSDGTKNVGWNAAPVWQPGYLRQITLSEPSVEPEETTMQSTTEAEKTTEATTESVNPTQSTTEAEEPTETTTKVVNPTQSTTEAEEPTETTTEVVNPTQSTMEAEEPTETTTEVVKLTQSTTEAEKTTETEQPTENEQATETEESKGSDSPQTGDLSKVALWAMMAALAAMTVLGMWVLTFHKKGFRE